MKKKLSRALGVANLISNVIISFWYRTISDYNGTIQIPNKVNNARGYFVTTILSDIGVPINRIKINYRLLHLYKK